MKHRSAIKTTAFLLGLCVALLSAVSCKKDSAVDARGVPHKDVPAEFQGQFSSVHTRGGYTDPYGGYYSGLSWGTVFNIAPNGTGVYVFRYDITYASGGQKKVRIEGDVAYEITKMANGRADIIIHFLRGKNYEDGKFLHDLDASKIYPNGDIHWTDVEYGRNAQGKLYFVASANDTYTQR